MIIIIIIMTPLTTLKAGIKPRWDSLPPSLYLINPQIGTNLELLFLVLSTNIFQNRQTPTNP
jgi:hypothetical protein